MKLNVQAIFDSIDGEENGFRGAGELTTFIRLKGCQLNCKWCDTLYAQESKPENWMTIDEIIHQVHFPKITITGGEPLLQRAGVIELLNRLITKHKVTVETNGTQYPPNLLAHSPEYVRFVVDYKLPSSGMESEMNPEVFSNLDLKDVIKFVISDEKDYKKAYEVIKNNPTWNAKKVFSPVLSILHHQYGSGGVAIKSTAYFSMSWPRQLVEMMIRDKVNAQFSLQLHKILWPDAKEER